MRSPEVPQILLEETEKLIGNPDTHAAHLSLDVSRMMVEYGEEVEDLAFRKEVLLTDDYPRSNIKLYFQGITVAIGFESEVLKRYLLVDGSSVKVIEDSMPEHPWVVGDDPIDEPRSHEASWLEIRDFQRLFDYIKPKVKNDQPKRSVREVLDRMWERIEVESNA